MIAATHQGKGYGRGAMRRDDQNDRRALSAMRRRAANLLSRQHSTPPRCTSAWASSRPAASMKNSASQTTCCCARALDALRQLAILTPRPEKELCVTHSIGVPTRLARFLAIGAARHGLHDAVLATLSRSERQFPRILCHSEREQATRIAPFSVISNSRRSRGISPAAKAIHRNEVREKLVPLRRRGHSAGDRSRHKKRAGRFRRRPFIILDCADCGATPLTPSASRRAACTTTRCDR